jgi:type I restriction enzyme, S subunit
MEKVSLLKIARINMGQSPLSESYNNVGNGLPFFQGKADFGEIYPRVRVFCTSPNRIAEANDILLSVRAPVGSINICKTKSCIGRGLAAIRATPEIEQKYLYYFLQFYEPYLAQIGKGSTFEAINREDVENIQIPLPKRDEQKRIAAILEKADRLRRQRRFAQTLWDSFLQSVFVKMFGEPANNPLKWKIVDLGDVLDLITYGLTVRPAYVKVGLPLISAQEIRSGSIDFINAPKIAEEDFLLVSQKGKPVRGDILFSKTGSIGHCAEVDRNIPFAITQNAARLSFKREVVKNSFAITYLRTKFFQELANREAKGNAVRDLQLGVLEKFPFLLPPLPLQENFARIAQQFHRIRRQQREATRQGEQLFQTLTRRAFRGEL